jgi:hypothetical protein
MSFRLLIECSKDIDELHINFSDGTSSIVSKDDNNYQKPKELKENREHKQYPKVKPKEEKENRRPLDTYLDTEDDVKQTNQSSSAQEKIALPVIPDKQSFKVADELQNLDI